MLTRDDYITILEKQAADEGASSYDGQETAIKEYGENKADNKAYLGDLFDNTGAVEKGQSKMVSKLFPGKGDKESGQVLMKVARAIFDEAMQQAEDDGLMKTASASYREVAFHSFYEELEKIAIQSSTAAHDAFMARPGAGVGVHHIADPLAAATPRPALSPAVQAMRAKAAKPGLLSRAVGALGFGK